MIHNRYNNKSKLITNINEFQLTNETEVIIYREEQYYDEIVVDLERQVDKFDELKPFIGFVAENLSKMDCIAQKYDGDDKFAENYAIAHICLDAPDTIKLTYFGTFVNTEFDVVFQCLNGELVLKSFGLTKNIPSDWNKQGRK
ncbi:MAG: hypothetical protein HFJ09_09360 [Lachnospiraceae bacterium]|nr:hypothetical protein [Lachnospiraceae bacterium]